MKNISRYFLIGTLLLGGCESQTEDKYAGIEGTGDRVGLASAYGTVSGFGSIYVNGVHFDTDTAEVEIAGAAASEEALAVGMVVDVVGEIDSAGKTGVAQRIRAERVVRGLIETVTDIGSGRKTLQILGQAVYVNEDATITGTSFTELAPGLGVNVSGFVTDHGLITATYIAKQDIDVALHTLEVEGYVDTVDEAAGTFGLKNLDVLIGSARFSSGTAQDLAPGRRVHVVGSLAEDQQSLLQATHIRFVARAVKSGRSASIEGVVRDLVAGESFSLQGVQVEMHRARIENGTVEEVETGAQVIAFGPLEQGVLQAERIRIKPLNTERFRGTVTDIDPQNNTFILLDTEFLVTRYTQFKDESRAMERYFNLESLRSGEEVEVFAVDTEDGLQVTRITRRDSDTGPRERLRGTPSQLSEDRSFYIDDVFVDATNVPEHEWTAVRNREGEAVEVEIEGAYIRDGHFHATHVHIRPGPPCHPHVFFECEQPKPTPPHAQ